MDRDSLHVQWDSDFFGFQVARVTDPDISEERLASVLRSLAVDGYRLVYWQVPLARSGAVEIAENCGGRLVDEKVTYVKRPLEPSDPAICGENPAYLPASYADDDAEPELVRLALDSGEHSRFRLDPLFPHGLFEKLYTCWIRRSVRREICWDVVVVRDQGGPVGLITLGDRENCGEIGLVAVASRSRRRGIGRVLVAEAEQRFLARGFHQVKVVSQRVNKSACRLYEACGFSVAQAETVFHFWL